MNDNSPLLQINTFLQKFAGTRVAYCPNPGNAGDSLIAAATLQIFSENNLDVEWCTSDMSLAPGKIVIYGGGGNLIPDYLQCRNFMLRNHEAAKRFILLPHTVRANEDLLASLGPNVDLILREPISYRHCKLHSKNAQVHLAEDLALELDADAFRKLSLPPLKSLKKTRTKLWRIRRAQAAIFKSSVRSFIKPGGFKQLYAFRTDGERLASFPLRKENIDISDLFMYKPDSADAFLLAAQHLLTYIDRYHSVHTDRLHVSIAAAILGKEVFFYPNSYFKNETIYFHSLQKRFPSMQWQGNRTI